MSSFFLWSEFHQGSSENATSLSCLYRSSSLVEMNVSPERAKNIQNVKDMLIKESNEDTDWLKQITDAEIQSPRTKSCIISEDQISFVPNVKSEVASLEVGPKYPTP